MAAGGDAMVTVLEGTGRFTVGGEVFLVSQGETLIYAQGYPPCGVRGRSLVQDAVDGVVLKIWCKIHWILPPKAPAHCVHHFCVRPQKFHTCGLRGILTDAPGRQPKWDQTFSPPAGGELARLLIGQRSAWPFRSGQKLFADFPSRVLRHTGCFFRKKAGKTAK